MAEQNNKIPPKSFIRKSEILENNTKPRLFSKSESSKSKIKPEVSQNSGISDGSFPLDAASKTYFGKCYEDHQVKLKLLELTPRNPAKETSEGVQEFIKQISKFIEKKNPFKDNVLHSSGSPEEKIDPAQAGSVKFDIADEDDQKFNILRETTFERFIDTTNENEKLKWEKPNSSFSLKRNPERVSQEKKNRTVSVGKKRNPNDKKNQKEISLGNKKNVELRRIITLNENPIFYYENERRSYTKTSRGEKKAGDPSTNKQNQTKKRKHSEIPLRKNRKDGSRNPKPVSLVLQKKDVERVFSMDSSSKNELFSPVQELGLCSEIQIIINATCSSEKLTESGKTSDCEPVKGKTFEEESNGNMELNSYCKSPNVIADNFLPTSLTGNLYSAGKKVKVLDLEKVKTASFTALRSNVNVFDRLESLHKRNISSKEKTSAKITSKSKILSPKASFGSVKEKVSRKNLSFRLSSKGNKPSLKVKGRKIKKEMEENFHLSLPKKDSKTKNVACLEIRKEIITTGKVECVISGICEAGNLENENFKTSQNKGRANKKNESNIPITIKRREDKSVLKKVGISKEKEELKTPSNATPVVPKMKTEDFPKFEKPEPHKNLISNKKSEKANLRPGNPDEKKSELTAGLKFHKITPNTPPPTPDISRSISETSVFENKQIEDDESSTKTVILDDKFIQENSSWCNNETETRKKPSKTKSSTEKIERKLKASLEGAKFKKIGLFIRGRPLNLGKDEPPEKPESSESGKVKMQLKIDLNSKTKTTKTPDIVKSEETFDWLYMNSKKYSGELVGQKAEWNENFPSLENEGAKESKIKCNHNTVDLIPSELTEEQMKSKTFDSFFRKSRKCCSSLKRKTQYKTSSVNLKGVRKKKLRSDTGDRRLPSSNSLFNSDLSLQNRNKIDTKLKTDLKEENGKDFFEDIASVKLRRRNSEPHSFKGFVWKRMDFAVPKGVRPSVSSVASSLRHLNTDDIDDFIFWEPVPQKMTSCWEMSLYHFKKPWTVLSCSVFKDNRQSNTPGLILENLRNGGNLNLRQFTASQNERMNCHKENPFDVEPSIAQKNIDIRNWLAALNFPTPPSTSNDAISEGHFFTQPAIDANNLNKVEVCAKRRKILPNIKFSDESPEKKLEDKEKYKTSTNWEASEAGQLMELIRRKSGGFVTKEQFLSSDSAVHCPNVTVNFCVYSKPVEKNDENTTTKAKAVKSLDLMPQPSVSIPSQSVEKDVVKEELYVAIQKRENTFWGSPLFSEINVWKYLFIFTLFIVIAHYFFLSSLGYCN